MKKLLIDAGNSGIKWSLLEISSKSKQQSKMKHCLYGDSLGYETFKDLLQQNIKNNLIKEIIMVSVLDEDFLKNVKSLLKELGIKLINVESSLSLAGVTSAYSEPHKLGADRLVAMIGVKHLKENQISIVIDSGTATTIDAIDGSGKHLGGVILPGIDLCTQSLLDKSEMLALLNTSKNDYETSVFAADTKQAISSGSILGQAGAIKNICLVMENEISKLSSKTTSINKVICGGAANRLLPYLSEEFEYHEDLIMQGLNVISDLEMSL